MTPARRSTDRWDEDDVRVRPSRTKSRPRSKDRPAHADAQHAMVVSVDRGKAEEAVARADKFGRFVTEHIDQLRRLIGNPVKHLMLRPVFPVSTFARILVYICRSPRKPDDKHIVPSIAIKVVQPVEKVVRVPITILRNWFVDFMLRGKFRPGKPVRTVDHVDDVVTVDIRRISTFRKINVRQLLPLECMKGQLIIISMQRTCNGEDR